MTDDSRVLRRVAWREIFPWLVLFRTFRTAVAPAVLLAAILGTLLSPVGRIAASYIFLTSAERAEIRDFSPAGGYPPAPGAPISTQAPAAVERFLPDLPSGVVEAFYHFVEPVWRVFHLNLTVRHVAYYVFVVLWTIAVWAFFGGLITRIAVSRLGPDHPVGLREAAGLVARRYLQYVFAPLYPLVGVVFLALLLAPVGLLMRMDLGVLLVGVVWILVVAIGLFAVWLLIGVLFGWPLMWPAIGAEREGDAFEAFSRSYAYVYGKPLHYLFYVAVAALFGTLAWALVNYAATMVVEFGFWATSWGAGAERTQQIRELALASPGHLLTSGEANLMQRGAGLIGLWLTLVRTVVTAFTYSFFWVNAAAIYLLLRYDVDGKEMDDVYEPEDDLRFAAGKRAITSTPAPANPGDANSAESTAPTDTAE